MKTNSSFPLSASVVWMSGLVKIKADLEAKSLKHSRPQNSYRDYDITEIDGRNWSNMNLPERYFWNSIFAILNPLKDI